MFQFFRIYVGIFSLTHEKLGLSFNTSIIAARITLVLMIRASWIFLGMPFKLKFSFALEICFSAFISDLLGFLISFFRCVPFSCSCFFFSVSEISSPVSTSSANSSPRTSSSASITIYRSGSNSPIKRDTACIFPSQEPPSPWFST